MKKLLLLALTAIMMVGCENPPEKTIGCWDVIVIDSCEYIRGYYRLAHKGNCKYCQERMKKMIKEVRNEPVSLKTYDATQRLDCPYRKEHYPKRNKKKDKNQLELEL